MGLFSGPGVTPSLKGNVTNEIALQGGEVWTITNAGWYAVKPGKYTSLQQYDPISQIWRTIGAGSTAAALEYFYSDGTNYRLANQTGCAVGAVITNAGTGYTSAPTVTASAGSSVWRAVVGGAISTTVTVTNAGTNYTYPPTVLFSAPPAGGVQATGYCTLSGGTISSVTVTDQGAGYNTAPTVTFINDPREGLNGTTIGYNASAATVLTGSGTITAILCLDHGNVVTGTTLPTFTFSGGGGSSLAATVIMCWSITGYNVSATTAGSGYATPVIISAYGGFSASNPAYVNYTYQSQLLKGRAAQIIGAVSSTALTTVGQVVSDGGVYPGIPTMYAYGFIPGANAVQAVFLSPTMGAGVTGVTGTSGATTLSADVSYITPI